MVVKGLLLALVAGGMGGLYVTSLDPATPQDRPSRTVTLAPTAYKPDPETKLERAIVAGGCFWGTEFYLRQVDGVTGTAVGYIGGRKEYDYPTYRQVCTIDTGHAEAVLVEFDPTVVSYAQILDVFWQIHNPTTVNRQGPDVGSQYRSIIFTLNDDQAEIAQKSKDAAARLFTDRIVTQIVEAPQFFMAEEYHQQYAAKTGKASCPIDRSAHRNR